MKLKMYSVFVLSVWLAFLVIAPVVASDSERNTGSITIRLEDTKDHHSKENVHIMVVKIADMEDGAYVLYDQYEKTGIDLNMLPYADELSSVAKKLERLKPKGKEVITDESGVAFITNLSPGVYLLYACDTAEYENVMPMLAANPMWSETEKKMVYDIEVFPKHAPETPNIPQTGDENRVWYYVMILTGAAMIGGLVAWKKRKKGGTLQKK